MVSSSQRGFMTVSPQAMGSVVLVRARTAWSELGGTDELASDAIPFDMGGAELSHRRGECSFEAILRRYKYRSQATPLGHDPS